MEPSPLTFVLFSLTMSIAIMILPHIIALYNFNKEKLLIWRKILIIVYVCYIPVIALLYGVYFASHSYCSFGIGPELLLPWWIGCYFGYIALTILVKNRTNLQLGKVRFIIFVTAGYLATTTLLVFISGLLGDPLTSLFIMSPGTSIPLNFSN
ncbi:MAG: hypothetical protein HY796_02750 [Elusimicrobia bacterium]|nr:hypothetical protein [Elusimicrobiota bacterium]